MKKWFLLPLIFCFLINLNVKSQFYETGQDPSSISWKQIKTKNYKLIFPAGFEESAQKYAATLDTIYPRVGKYLSQKPKPVTVVFHTQSSLSNGLVVYAPKRMELYTIPPQDNYPQDWLDQLALHETRHVVQMDALNHGIARLGYYLAGEQAVGAISGMVPRWFLEGDAVYSETMFSQTGRGRSASFAMPYRTMALNRKKLFSYEKALLGSYKDFVPDYYAMGYPMVKMARDSFNPNIFGTSLHFTARNPYLVFPFGHSLRNTSGLNNRLLYKYTYSTLKKEWAKQDTQHIYQHWPVPKSKTYTNYNFPTVLDTSTLLLQKWSQSRTRCFVAIDNNGKEKRILTPGTNSGERVSVFQNKITWSEYVSDLRWQNRTFSEIMVYDVSTKKLKRITRKTWYFSPCFSPDGKYIAAIEETPEYNSSLVIIETATRKLIRKVEAPDANHLQHPVWAENNEIFCLAVKKEGKSIVKLNEAGNWEEVIPDSYKNISNYCLAEKGIVFAGENEGIINLFYFDTETKKFFQITKSRFGAFEPFYDANNHRILFSDYTSEGYKTSYLDWTPKEYPETDYIINSNKPIETGVQEPFDVQTIAIANKNYPVRPYSKASHLFNIHSWAPLYYNYSLTDISNPNISPGLMVLSQNMLGTMVSSFGYAYENGYSHLHANMTYKAFYPVISWSLDAGGPVDRIGGNETYRTSYSNNIQSTVTVSLPLNLTRGNLVSGLTPYLQWKYNRDAYFLNSTKRYYQDIHNVTWGINYYLYKRMAVRDFSPRLGFSTFFKMQSTPFENKIFNSMYAFNFRFYAPGLFRHHSLQLRYGYQYQSPLSYLYSTMLAFPPGYASGRTENLNLFGASYSMPLLYPDMHLGLLMYLKRIRANFFYEGAYNEFHEKGTLQNNFLRSIGTDIIADVHFMRIMFPFQVGARLGYLPHEKEFFGQAIFSIDLVY